ncbi:hypothetical protein JRQ81_018688 [Phrynocephalus forsythii]|uniref:Uncharacterized protein n=1 Tax=Phrynocephalus forsythii TaxID=171643 RepID=A0A9Q1AZ01_9SAUR|nr:hypothetical protein JRQ81_018688 [Phrynocephalus forsythii]
MGWQLLGALPAAVALVALTTNVGHAAELRGATWEAEGDPRKGDVASFRLSRATQRSKPTFYRTGSLSALSRGLMTNLSVLQELQEEEGAPQHKREASPARDACRGCCGAPFPNHTEGSREPAREDSGHLGSPPPPKPPKRTPIKGSPRPGAYTPMGKLRQGSPAEGHQNESFPGMNGHGHQEAQATERCRGCCGPNGTAADRPQDEGRKDEGPSPHRVAPARGRGGPSWTARSRPTGLSRREKTAGPLSLEVTRSRGSHTKGSEWRGTTTEGHLGKTAQNHLEKINGRVPGLRHVLPPIDALPHPTPFLQNPARTGLNAAAKNWTALRV